MLGNQSWRVLGELIGHWVSHLPGKYLITVVSLQSVFFFVFGPFPVISGLASGSAEESFLAGLGRSYGILKIEPE